MITLIAKSRQGLLKGNMYLWLHLAGSSPSARVELPCFFGEPHSPSPPDMGAHSLLQSWRVVQAAKGPALQWNLPRASWCELGRKEPFPLRLRSSELSPFHTGRVCLWAWMHMQRQANTADSTLASPEAMAAGAPVPCGSLVMSVPCISWCYMVNCHPERDMLKFQLPISQHVTLFGNRVVADVK